MIAQPASSESYRLRTDSLWWLFYWTLLALVFAGAIWQRFRLPLDPIADPDTWGYLSPALRKLTGAEFGHTNGRNFIYPGFVLLVLRLFADFRAITIAQHFLGLLAGAVFLLTWKRARIFVPNPRIGRVAHDLLGLAGAAIFLLQWQTIVFEKEIRPEGICAFALSITFYLLIQFLACFFLEHRRTATVAYAIALAFTAIFLASIKPSFGLASLFVLSPIIALFWRSGWWWQKVWFSLGFVFSAAVLLLPEHFLSRNDEMSRTFVPTTLFVVHAELIRDQLANDLAKNVSLPYSRDRLERLYLALRTEIEKSRTARQYAYHSVGFDADFLMYDPNSIAVQARREFRGDVTALCAFYRFYYGRIWEKRPLQVLAKVARQMQIFYLPYCRAYDPRISRKLGGDYRYSVVSLSDPMCRKVWMDYPPAVDFMNRTEELARRELRFRLLPIIPTAVLLMSISYLTWLAIALVLAVIVVLTSGRWRRLRFIAALVVFSFSFNAACCLEVATIISLENRRYMTVQMYSTLLAQLLGFWFILEFVVQMWERRRVAHAARVSGDRVPRSRTFLCEMNF
ncbi:MAG: hypothetical protein DMF14_09980 [Verrucomicrobia bacterium]|nr:MAG: hypothetical protein DMF14_09980 [Verrucomicrobiota bacterium]